jgi:hypothetical protein
MAVEIDENELAGLKSLQSTVQKWLGNPGARRKILEAQKVLDPNIVIPELDAAKPLEEALAKMDEKLSTLDKRLSKDAEDRETAKKLGELNSRWEKGRSELRTQGYTDEGITKIEKLMEERGIADHDAGSALFDRMNPPEVPIAPQNSGFDVLMGNFNGGGEAEAASKKALFENPDAWLNGEISRTLGEVRNGKK